MDASIKVANPNVKGFFDQKRWRKFIQGSVARWMMSFPKESNGPCCSLDVLGGDGTGIGITVKNVSHVQPVWNPPSGTRDSRVLWGRKDRCVYDLAPVGKGIGAQAFKDARTWLKKACSVTVNQAPDVLKDITVHRSAIPSVICAELDRWCGMLSSDTEFMLLRFLLRCLTCEDSVTGLIHPSEICTWRRCLPSNDDCCTLSDWSACKSILVLGVSRELVQLLDAQLSKTLVQVSTIRLIKFMGGFLDVGLGSFLEIFTDVFFLQCTALKLLLPEFQSA
jgi:hypothetical protein